MRWNMTGKKAACCLLIVLALVMLTGTVGFAESNAMDIGLAFLKQAMDLSNVETFTANAPEYGTDEIDFWFDFRDGWHVVMVLHNGKFISTMPMDDIKLLNGLCNLLPLFPQIQAHMPKGVEVSFTVAFTDENRQLITMENYSQYLWN